MKLKEILKSTIYVTPNLPVTKTKRYRFNVLMVLSGIVLYTLIVIILLMVLLTFTGAKNLVFFLENEKLTVQTERINELEHKIILLTRELETVASQNRKLKYAIILAGVDSLDSNSVIYDSLRFEKDKNLPAGGNILQAFISFYDWMFQIDRQKDNIYFINPCKGFIIKKFDYSKGHLGIDFGIHEGTPIFASAGGLVVFSGYTENDGNMIMIQHENGYITVYKHCSILLKKSRDYVLQGDNIALSGNSGSNTTGPHLHFEIWKNGKVLDPEKFLINNKKEQL